MQIKSTLRFLLIPVRMAIFKNKNNHKCWWGYGEAGSFVQCWWECKLVQPLWKSPQKSRTTYDPLILLLGIYPKERKSEHNRDTCALIFIVPLFIIAKLWKQPRCFTTDEWIKKISLSLFIYIYYSTIRKNDTMCFESKWM
jgi:hypothetical protein